MTASDRPTSDLAPAMVAEATLSSAIWSRRREEITFDRLHKFWSTLSPRQRNELLRLDKQTLIEHARKNLYCSRCNGLLLESFAQIVMYGKSLHQESLGERRIRDVEAEEVQDPSVHPWGGLSTTKDGILTVLDCFMNAKSLHILQNVFDNARAREREREMLYPDACGGGGRGWISPVIPNYGRGHGTRDTCALHTARLSCDTLVDFWSALGEESRLSLLRMKEEDFIERLMHRFDSKRFCRDCRRNVIREFKELKELKRMRKEPHCTSWFCVADTAFTCEVFEDAVIVDWQQSLLEQDGSYDHFEWGIGTDEGKSDILNFENVGLKGHVQRKGLDLDQFEDYFVTLRAWLGDHCTEFCVKAHALKGQSCVHRRLIVGDGFVTITKGESIRSFFEHAEEAEEEDEDDAMDRDGNDPDNDAVHPQKHAKSPELAREFLLDAAAVIFKEQVEKAFREGTARQNAHSVFVSLALKLLEERVHVACKEIITLEKQTKLLEEEEKEKREEEERRERRRAKEREKKHRRKERLKGKDKDKEKTAAESKTSDDMPPPSLIMPTTQTNNQSQDIEESRYSSSDDEDKGFAVANYCLDTCGDQSSGREIDEKEYQCDPTKIVPTDCKDSFLCEQPKSSRQNLRLRRDFTQERDRSYWHEDCQDDCGDTEDIQHQYRERTKNVTRGYNSMLSVNNRTRDRYDPCSCGHQEDYRYFPTTARPSREMKMARKTVVEKPRLQYRRCYPLDSFTVSKGRVGGTPNKNAGPKQVWEPMDVKKKANLGNANTEAANDADRSNQLEGSKDINECQKVETGCKSISEVCSNKTKEPCKSDTDQRCEEGEKNQAACNNGTHVASKTDHCLTKDTGRAANLTSSDSSSCLSEGDRDSSMSSMTSLSAQNAESDSEESSERNNSSPGDPPTKNGCRSLLEMCAGNGFREFKPENIQRLDSKQTGFGIVTPFQDQLLRHQKVQAPPYSSTFVGFHGHTLSVPTNGYIPYTQPSHFYPSSVAPVGYGIAGSPCVDFPVQYGNNLHPYSGSEFGYVPPQPVHNAPVSFHTMPPGPLCRNGAPVVMIPERQQNHVIPTSSIAVPQNGCSEDKSKEEDDSTPFSLFQFNLPIAPPAPAASKEKQCGGAVASSPEIAQSQPCSREETNIKEYNLFSSGCTGVLFPFD